MTNAVSPAQKPPEAKRPRGAIERALLGLFMRDARVAAVEQLSAHCRLIDLEGPALRGVDWAPGQKIQVSVGGLMSARTYTPINWDPARGATRILAYSHGTGPGSDWAGTLATGDSCQFFGPRRSLDLAGLPPGSALFGDETGLGLAASLLPGLDPARIVLEATSGGETRPVLDALGLGAATVIERRPDDTHLAAVEAAIAPLAAGGGVFVLTGKAGSVQQASRGLKTLGVTSSRLRAKAYWAPGKVGLD